MNPHANQLIASPFLSSAVLGKSNNVLIIQPSNFDMDQHHVTSTKQFRHFTTALISGGVAGVAVDCILFPLDTIKTRLQSEQGFRSSGGFRRIYAGLGSTVVGSVPSAAIFFAVYEGVKSRLPPDHPMSVMVAASAGEIAACSIRVPVEVVKQRTQARGGTSWINFKKTISSEGIRGLYRGYTTTIFREIPFSFIQFPVWEYLKLRVQDLQGGKPCTPLEATICGALAGGFAAFCTNPLDVSKTRVMLAEKESSLSSGSVLLALRTIYIQKGIRGLFSGVLPRVIWISTGGAIFLGGYEKTAQTLESYSSWFARSKS